MLIFDQLKKNDPQLRVLAWVALAGLGILLVGLWYVQIIAHRHYVENQKAQSFRTVRIPAIRGKILDRNGRALAENQPNYHISIYLEELRDLFKERWKRTRPKTRVPRQVRLALEAQCRYQVVSNIVENLRVAMREPVSLSFEEFIHHYTNQLALPLPIISISNYTQIARFHEQQNYTPGVDLDMRPLRWYPYKSTAAHLLGYLKFNNSSLEGEDAFFNYRLPDYQGLIGIEGTFDQELRGKAGVKSVLVNNLGYRQSENIWLPAEPGKNVVLTIDLDLQQIAESALQKAMFKVQGAVVIMDPKNGDILALASAPAFDPNMFIPHITQAYWEKLSDENLKLQRNRATQDNYHPGSIFKIVVSLACLEAGLDPEETIQNPGYIQIGRRTIPDTARRGEYDFHLAFIKSSNTYFVTNGLRYGISNILRLGYRLHLGERTGIPTWQEAPGRFPTPEQIRQGWSPGDTANICIGQGDIDVTPLQMAVMVSAIANGGKVYWPRLVQRIEPQDPTSGEAVQEFKTRLRDQLGVSSSTLKIVRDAMLADVEEDGTGREARLPGLHICGKTGTAQIKDEHGNLVDHTTWFASYAPYENPRYVVIVMVESGASGGLTCGPVVQRIYQWIKKLENQAQNRNATLAEAK